MGFWKSKLSSIILRNGNRSYLGLPLNPAIYLPPPAWATANQHAAPPGTVFIDTRSVIKLGSLEKLGELRSKSFLHLAFSALSTTFLCVAYAAARSGRVVNLGGIHGQSHNYLNKMPKGKKTPW